jgi:hypothetical protein
VEKYFNPDETYDKAIRNKDVGVLRALLTGIIGSDPTFVTSEFAEAQAYIKDKSIELYGEELILNEDFKKQEDEIDKTVEGEWDEQYFQMNLVWLRDNFNLTDRLPKIKTIGEAVYRNKKTLGKSKVENRTRSAINTKTERKGQLDSKKTQAARPTGGGDYEKRRLSGGVLDWAKNHWLLMVVIAIAIFGLVFLGIKLLGRN